MNIYLNDFDCIGNSSVFRSSGIIMPFYCIISFILPWLYIVIVFFATFCLHICRMLLYFCSVNHLLAIFSILNIFILST